MAISLDETARQEESDLPKPEFDWTLDEEARLTVPEQEARFQVNKYGKFRTTIKASCLACGMPHSLSSCPYIFEDNPKNYDIRKEPTLKFNNQWNSSPEFREAVVYLRKKFTSRDVIGYQIPVPRSETQDAPPLARGANICLCGPNVYILSLKPNAASTVLTLIVWLSNFDKLVLLHGTGSDKTSWTTDFKKHYEPPMYSFFPGYYATTDNDGRPFLLLYANSGHIDSTLPYEIDMIRTFVAKYNKGEKALVDFKIPDMDTRPIGVVIVTKRWHKSSSSVRHGQPCITVGVASEYTWFHGYARWGIHINAKGGLIENGYSGWSSGRLKEFGATTAIEWSADTAYQFNNANSGFIAGLGYALLRDLREPVEKISGMEESARHWNQILFWRRILLHRAATFYGTSSPQYRLVYAYAQGKYGDVEAADRDIPALDAVPRWKHIQSRMSMAGKPYEEETIMRSIFH